MDNYFTEVAVAAASRHHHIEANRRPLVLPGIEQALQGVWQEIDDAAAVCVMAAAAAKERGCAEMRSRRYVHDVVAASKADAAETRRAAEAKAAARATALGPELTGMIVAAFGNTTSAFFELLETGNSKRLEEADWTVTVTYSQ